MATLAASSTNKSKTRSRIHIDMTPMVDLAFLLLTFFVMTSTLMKPYAMELLMPNTSETDTRPPIQANRVLNLVLDKNDVIHWYIGTTESEHHQTNFSSSGVRKLLIDKNREIKKMHVLVKPSDQSKYKNIIDLLDEFAITRIENYSIVEVEPADKNFLASAN